MNTIFPWIILLLRKVLCIRTGDDTTEINGTEILDTYAEGFPIWISRIVITAATRPWAYRTAVEATGFATSKIGCPCEAGIERYLTKKETPDGRVGVSILVCTEKKNMKANVASRISQCILPAPTASAFDGFPESDSRFFIRMHYFGDTYEERCVIGGRKCWKIPIMEGNYIGEERFGTVKGIAGGNFLVMGKDQESALTGIEAAADAIAGLKGVITSFAGGVVASGSKVGSKNYRFPLPASTNHCFCPTLKDKIIDSKVPEGIGSMYEIVMNGIDETLVKAAMKAGILAATETGRVRYIGASNFEGKLGQYRLYLRDLFR
jgi:formylmethanofuran--tetrahydromethanopterin N-formyltransferase